MGVLPGVRFRSLAVGRREDDESSSRVRAASLLAQILAIDAEVNCENGWPRAWKELLARGIRVGKDRVQRLMRLNVIDARGEREFVVTTNSRNNSPVAPNLLARDFTPSAPDRAWSSDR